MGLQCFPKFQQLLKQGHYPAMMGFKGDAGDITRLSNRVRLARSFRSLDLEGYSKDTVAGYNAFFQVFLTHSALERYLTAINIGLDGLDILLKARQPEAVLKEFHCKDKDNRLFNFLHERVNKKLKVKLEECRSGSCTNVAYVSACIRHIFAHGELTANTHRINPKQTYCCCKKVSDFLLDFMDSDFDARLERYCLKKGVDIPSGVPGGRATITTE